MRFSLRDLLLVTVIVALALGWWVDHVRQAYEIERAHRAFYLPPPPPLGPEALEKPFTLPSSSALPKP